MEERDMQQQQSIPAAQEIKMKPEIPPFREVTVSGTEPAWCVDGRADHGKSKGPQMLGGSLHPIILSAVSSGENLSEKTMQSGLAKLKESGFSAGVHRGSHKHPEHGTCDCGFADRMPHIIQTAVQRQGEITRRLTDVYLANKKTLAGLDEVMKQNIEGVFAKLAAYTPEKFEMTGETLIQQAEGAGAQVEDVEGDHAEAVAYVNLKKGATLDTNGLNDEGKQAFNLDVWAAVEQSKALGVDEAFATLASLILYVATEMVLVEDKGKPALSVALHS